MKSKIITSAILLLILHGAAFAHTVTMNMAYNISVNDTIYANGSNYSAQGSNLLITFTSPAKKYISSNASSSVAGIMFAGSDFVSIQLNTSSGIPRLSMSQLHGSNRFLIFFTNGTYANPDSSAAVAEDSKIIPRTIGGLAVPQPLSYVLYMRLEHPEMDITSRSRWGSGFVNLMIKNRGRTAEGLANVTIEVL
jgi:hypothetical protein